MPLKINNPNHYLNPEQDIALRIAALDAAARIYAGAAARPNNGTAESKYVLEKADAFLKWLTK